MAFEKMHFACYVLLQPIPGQPPRTSKVAPQPTHRLRVGCIFQRQHMFGLTRQCWRRQLLCSMSSLCGDWTGKGWAKEADFIDAVKGNSWERKMRKEADFISS